ncbi:MAG: deoxycytidine triphosphate deaminase [candidate division WS6 bacterium 34_10]|jgi:dCTP deaminase|uniref:dCTP deaminase n=1 Tax=candidate division WS6 bacterium 34_10 TaxID=1641389 RepID=A0A101HHN4_9BACT|nr:MAG: deoxycytidine triphosphate deaminase [candidate division WS6 bacterium 34_10]
MVLSDKGIKKALKEGHINIDPFVEENLQPASYDLHLGKTLLLFDRGNNSLIDIKKPMESLMVKHEIGEEGYILHPKEFILANIKEVTGVDDQHVGFLHGKSSLARIGLLIHATAGLLDPGNELRLTLEMYNLSPLPIKLYPDMKIAQITFESIDNKCERPYGSDGLNSKYKGDMVVKGSKMYKNYNYEKK